MLRNMAFTQVDLDTLDEAIKGSELSVRFPDGSSVTYRSVDELINVRNLIRADLSTTSTSSYPRHQIARFDD